ncbi:PAS domain-containing protein [Sphingomonas sp. RS2018]
MDIAGEIDRDTGFGEAREDGAVGDAPIDIGGDERRMHVRAYNHWVSLLQGRAFPSIENLDPNSIADFGPYSVLLDFTEGLENPRIQFLGGALRDECGVVSGMVRIDDVPSRSLLSRLTAHYLQIIANRAPIGFEAEFVGQRGHNTLYRGILMPFSSDGDGIDFIYGVINWKELVEVDLQAQLTDDLAAARRAPVVPASVWADGPGAGFDDGDDTDAAPTLADDASIHDRLDAARRSADAFAASEGRSRSALYAALGLAHGLAIAARDDAEGFAEMLADAGVTAQARAPMTPVVKLVFGAGHDKTRLAEYASVLNHAARHEVGANGLTAYLESFPGGVKGVVGAERALKRPAPQPDLYERIAAELRERAPLAHVAIDPASADGEFVVLLARRDATGGLDVVACVDSDKTLTERTVRRAAA